MRVKLKAPKDPSPLPRASACRSSARGWCTFNATAGWPKRHPAGELQDCRIAELQEGFKKGFKEGLKEEGGNPAMPFCNPAIL
jgi:hypothetical protein